MALKKTTTTTTTTITTHYDRSSVTRDIICMSDCGIRLRWLWLRSRCWRDVEKERGSWRCKKDEDKEDTSTAPYCASNSLFVTSLLEKEEEEEEEDDSDVDDSDAFPFFE